MEEALKILESKARKFGSEYATKIVSILAPKLWLAHTKDPRFPVQFARAVPPSYLRDSLNVILLSRLLDVSTKILDKTSGPGGRYAGNMKGLLLAAVRRCHTSTKYHVVRLVEDLGSEVGIVGLGKSLENLGRVSKSNVQKTVRALLLHAHPIAKFSPEEALRHHRVASIVYLAGYIKRELLREWIEKIRQGLDVQLDKYIGGSFQVGKRLVLLTSSLRRMLEAFDYHFSCHSPHESPSVFAEIVRNPYVIPIVVLGERNRVLARITGYYYPNETAFIIGSRVYGWLTKREALRIFQEIKNRLGVDVYVPMEYEPRGIPVEELELPIKAPITFRITDDYVTLYRGALHATNLVKI